MKTNKQTIAEKKRQIEFEKRERYCLTQILLALKEKNPEYKYSMYLSPIDSKTPYDAILTIRNLKEEVIKTYIIEAKNRSNIYKEMYLEKSKLNGLTNIKPNLELELDRKCELIYMNFTPVCTFIFSLDEMELGKSKRALMAHESFADEVTQRNKLVYSLPLTEAIKMKFKYDEMQYLKSIEPVKVAPIEVTQKVKTASIF